MNIFKKIKDYFLQRRIDKIVIEEYKKTLSMEKKRNKELNKIIEEGNGNLFKYCNKCKQYKKRSEFSKHIKAKDGLQWQCKECQHALNKDYRESIKAKSKENKEEIGIGNKHCNRCNQDKSVLEFAKDRTRKDGLQQYCKKCHNTIMAGIEEKIFQGGILRETKNFLEYIAQGEKYVIMEHIHASELRKKYGKDLFQIKLEQMIKYNNKNKLWKTKRQGERFYVLKNRLDREIAKQIEF